MHSDDSISEVEYDSDSEDKYVSLACDTYKEVVHDNLVNVIAGDCLIMGQHYLCGTSTLELPGAIITSEGLQLQIHIEKLKGSCEASFGSKSSQLKKESVCFSDDDVEMPDFSSEELLCAIRHDNISDEEDNRKRYGHPQVICDHPVEQNIVGNENQRDFGSWNAIGKESGTCLGLDADDLNKHQKSCSDKHYKGTQGRTRSKFSFHSQHCIDRSSLLSAPKNEPILPSVIQDLHEEVEFDASTRQCPAHDPIEDYLLNELLETEDLEHASAVHSMADAAKSNQGSNGAEVHANGEDLSEQLSSGSSSDESDFDGDSLQALERKKHNISDRFQEVFDATCCKTDGSSSKLFSIGLFRQLQQVMQDEKEVDNAFLNKLQTGTGLNSETRAFVVKILSRCLDARLTMCHCLLGSDLEELRWLESDTTLVDKSAKGEFIFSPRVCGNVDLEVGNYIRVCYPWLEVEVADGEERKKIILSSYFLQVMT